MLRFASFFPMTSLMKIELAFGDEKITHKFKSLAEEGEIEIPYSRIANIQFVRQANMGWVGIGTIIAIIPCAFILALCYLFPETGGNLVVLTTGKILFLMGIALFIPSFIKRDLCYFYDKDRKYITVIAITDKNLDDVYEAVEFVKTKTTIFSETYPDLVDEDEYPKFKLIVYFSPNYLNKNTTLFYEDKILDMEKSLLSESASEYKYSDLQQKTSISKHGDPEWDTVAGLLTGIGVIISLGLILFFPDAETGMRPLLVAAGLSLISIFMRYVKNEIVFFYDKNDNVAFHIKIPRGGKQKVEEIIQFVKTKVSETPGA